MVNKENPNQFINFNPYQECLQFIVKTSYCLIDGGESQFIDFIHLEQTQQKNRGDIAYKEIIKEFDFALGIPLARQYTSFLMFKDFYNQYCALLKEIKKILIHNAKKGINNINEIPSATVKCSRALMFIEQIEKEINLDFNLDYIFLEINKIIFSNLALRKEDLFAPLTYWQEDTINAGFYLILNKLETIANAYFYFLNLKDEKFRFNLILLKENLMNYSTDETYEKSIFLAKLLKIIVLNHEKAKQEIQVNEKFYENQVFIERLGHQLSRKNEDSLNIKSLQKKMTEQNSNKISFNDLIDEEIHNLNQAISKENITRARLEMRLNDTEYPLSVAYREYVKSTLQFLEE
ncbi:hypothetical protein QEJ31_09495 [Pigmentibacter sp. JX0631]|uniref:hypothetical protein n=1 Tax=Pigmentibacter sp. JX0631 TaxID=2976982 RepID=UPI002468746F|nr:hypothetical protein [Pigmentibacter sp. JX0631]WGL58758.1 hypothetical protein QEJ31_09495 [Pigmentibacter sp. JX0631]